MDFKNVHHDVNTHIMTPIWFDSLPTYFQWLQFAEPSTGILSDISQSDNIRLWFSETVEEV
jgi:hypothetical protein